MAAEIRGSIDGFEGLYMAGWAIAQPDDHTCAIEIRDAGGQVVASGRATQSRPDLAVLGFGRTSFAFRIALREIETAALFTVTADGQELHGSPIRVGRGIFDGFTNVASGHLDGWVTERAAAGVPPVIEVVDDHGRVLGTMTARRDRTDEDPLYVPWRFYMPVPAACIGRPGMRVHIRVNGVAIGAPLAISMAGAGALERITPTRCTGWLGMREAPYRRFAIEVFRDGVKVGSGMADHMNALAEGETPGRWDVGFDIPLREPDPGAPADGFALSVRLAGSDVELFGGPFIVGDRAGLIAATHKAARLAHSPTLEPATQAVLQAALAAYAAQLREGEDHAALPSARRPRAAGGRRLSVLIPVYRNVEVTRACIDSVLAQRDPARDTIVLVNDCSPDAEMAGLLQSYGAAGNVVVLSNAENVGFVQSVNRGLAACTVGDVLLLNSDTRLFAGAIEELVAVAHDAPDIGTATALSNNATIFTYPATNAPDETIADVGWEELAGEALARQRGAAVDVPTAHGFCMLITRAMLDRIGGFDAAFGRGYGEENDFCQRGADLGFRHVAAIGVFVEHRERTSFGAEREALLRTNLAVLTGLYPEYDAVVAAHEARDPLRRARWTLHRYRLAKMRASTPGRAVLVVGNQLGGGTARAEREIETAVGYGGAMRLRLSCTRSGGVELAVDAPAITARIAPEDFGDLFGFLDTFGIDMVLVHHVLGYTPDFIAALGAFASGRRAVWYAHDFYPICPRVTLIDATGGYCGGPEAARCVRCFDLGGGHEASRTGALTPDEHRALFADLLGRMTQIVAPSEDAAAHLRAVLPEAPIISIGHPHLGPPFPAAARDGTWTDIALLGAIGPHKGSAELLALARRASLTHPALRFHVIGFTDIDARLAELDNVSITGRYEEEDLAGLIAASGARIALFLHVWPETYSYTLSEAVAHGLIPVVPDIGAPAERVRACGFGTVFPHPFDAARVLDTLAGLAEGRVAFSVNGGTPARFDTPDAAGRIGAVFSGEEAGKTSRLRRQRAIGPLNP